MNIETTHTSNKTSLRGTKQSLPLVPELRFKEFDEEWQILKLNEVAKIARGKFTPRPRNNPIYYNGDIPFVQTSDVVNANGKIEVYKQTLNEKGLAVSKLFPAGTILITIAANIGHVGVLQIDMACPDSLIGITTNNETHNYFLNYYLATHQQKMDYLAPEGAQKNINIDFLNPYKVPSTSLPEQQKIASFLTAVDTKIQQLTKKAALLAQYKKGVMQQLFSGKLRFKPALSEVEGDEHGNAYPDWEEKRLGDVGKIVSGLTYSPDDIGDDGVLVLRSSNVHGRRVTYDDNVYVKVVEGGYNPVQENDILICVRNGSKRLIGKNALINGEAVGVAFGAFMTVYRSKSNLFLFHFFDSSFYKKEVHKNLGATINSINGGNLKKFKVPFPSLPEQQKIATYLSSIDNKIETINNQITQTQTFKKGLLQQLFV